MLNDQSHLSEIAVQRPESITVFRKYGLDYCCGGNRPLAEACVEKHLNPLQVLAEITERSQQTTGVERWDDKSIEQLIPLILDRFHRRHREELRELLALARKVEAVHAGKPLVPRGLLVLLTHIHVELEDHMNKEEGVLFPWLLQHGSPRPHVPIKVMMTEHLSHKERLLELRRVCHEFKLPEDACGSWRRLYKGVEQLISDIMEHIHIENNILFPMAVSDSYSTGA